MSKYRGSNFTLPSTHRDLDDGFSVLTTQNLRILYIFVAVILFYLFCRIIFSSGAGIATFQPEYCYQILGYAGDTSFIQSRCWADLVKTQIANTNSQASFTYWAPANRRDFQEKLNELKKVCKLTIYMN